MSTVAIIGAGITGVTTAYALARRGVSVTVFERHRYAAMETSHANGGQISASNSEAWNHPSTLLKGLKWMLRQDAPLLLNARPSWHKLAWLAEFVAQLRHYERNTIETVRLAIAARRHLFEWAQDEGIDFDLERRGILHIYRDRSGFEHAAKVSALLARGGLVRTSLTGAEIRNIEPALAGRYYGGWFTESDCTGDVHKFTEGLAQAAIRRGVDIRYEHEVRSVRTIDSRVRVHSSFDDAENAEDFDLVVICAGHASRALAKSLGDRINVYPVKGYSITVQLADAGSREAAPRVSLLDDATKIVSSRLGNERLRVAGTAEFNGFSHDIRAERIRPLVRWVRDCFPGVDTRHVIPWAGLRPMLPGMLPRVGRGRRAGVFYNTGHGHLGWTLSAATAEILALSIVEAHARSKFTWKPEVHE